MVDTKSIRYRAMLGSTGWCYLREYSETLDGIKEIIDETYAEQIALGYDPDKTYAITCEEYNMYYGIDGRFARREIIENFVEMYNPESKAR